MLRHSQNTLYSVSALLIIAIIAAIGGTVFAVHGGKLNIGVTTNQIVAAETAYAAALTVADNYVNACRNGTIPATCKTTATAIQKDVLVTNAAYQTIKGFETNPPTGAAQTFLDAVATLQAALPVVTG